MTNYIFQFSDIFCISNICKKCRREFKDKAPHEIIHEYLSPTFLTDDHFTNYKIISCENNNLVMSQTRQMRLARTDSVYTHKNLHFGHINISRSFDKQKIKLWGAK